MTTPRNIGASLASIGSGGQVPAPAVSGSAALAVPAPAAAGSGAVAVSGSGAPSIPAPTASGEGGLPVTGTGALSIPTLTSTAAGSIGSAPVALGWGHIGAGLRNIGSIGTAAGAGSVSGTASLSIPRPTMSATGEVAGGPTGTSNLSVPAPTMAAAGTVEVGSGGSNPPTVSFSLNRSSGVAPLDVMVDASATTATGVSRPFHHLGYEVDWGDGTKTTGAPLATKVYTTPGSYTITVRAVGVGNAWATSTASVTVQDPDVVFPGVSTVCFSNTADFTGAPAGAHLVTLSSFTSAITTHLGPNKRLLFKRGDTFTSGGSIVVSATAPMLLGAFGAGTGADSRGMFANDPIISKTGGGIVSGASNSSGRLVLEHLRFETGTAMFNAIEPSGDWRNALFLRCYVGEATKAIALQPTSGNSVLAEDITFAYCDFNGFTQYGFFGSGRRLTLLGNRWRGPSNISEHQVRINLGLQVVVEDNDFEDNVSTFKTSLKIVGSTDSVPVVATDEVVVRGNRFAVSCNWPISFQSQNSGSGTGEQMRNGVFENNRLTPAGAVDTFVVTSGVDVTVRNNVVWNTTSADFGAVVLVARWTTVVPTRTEIYCNTGYTTTSSISMVGGQTSVGSPTHDGAVIVANNAATSTSGSEGSGSGVTIDAAGNLYEASMDWADVGAGDFHIGESSAAIGAGSTIPVYFDADGLERFAFDVGAFSDPSGSSSPTGGAFLQVPAPTMAASGALTHAGTGAPTIPAPTMAATGQANQNISGTAALAVQAPTAASAGALTHAGTAALSVPAPTGAASGAVFSTFQGTAALAIPTLGLVGDGLVIVKPAPENSVALFIPRPTMTASAVVLTETTGTGTLSVPAPLCTAAGTVTSPSDPVGTPKDLARAIRMWRLIRRVGVEVTLRWTTKGTLNPVTGEVTGRTTTNYSVKATPLTDNGPELEPGTSRIRRQRECWVAAYNLGFTPDLGEGNLELLVGTQVFGVYDIYDFRLSRIMIYRLRMEET